MNCRRERSMDRKANTNFKSKIGGGGGGKEMVN